jgi:hypothetical protein
MKIKDYRFIFRVDILFFKNDCSLKFLREKSEILRFLDHFHACLKIWAVHKNTADHSFDDTCFAMQLDLSLDEHFSKKDIFGRSWPYPRCFTNLSSLALMQQPDSKWHEEL